MKRLLTLAIAAVAATSLMAATASAAPTGDIKITITPKGQVYNNATTSANLSIVGNIVPGVGDATVDPMYNLTTRFTKDLTFNTTGVPECTQDIGQINPGSANISSAQAVAKCPNSVVGSGTAKLYLGGAVGPGGTTTLNDPTLVAFNGGTDNQGNPRIYIHGYSPGTTVGVIMIGSLVNGTLSLDIPPLTADSGVGYLELNLPGSGAPGVSGSAGKDPNYVQVKCTSGTWNNGATFKLGTANGSGGFNPTMELSAESPAQKCDNTKALKVKFAVSKVKGPKSVKKGKKGTYKVTVKNTGKAGTSATVKASGKGAKGSASTGLIAAGKSKTVKVKVKFTKKGKVKTSFKVTGKNIKTTVKRVTVNVK